MELRRETDVAVGVLQTEVKALKVAQAHSDALITRHESKCETLHKRVLFVLGGLTVWTVLHGPEGMWVFSKALTLIAP